MVYSKLPPLYSFLEEFNNLKETNLYYDEKVGGDGSAQYAFKEHEG